MAATTTRASTPAAKAQPGRASVTGERSQDCMPVEELVALARALVRRASGRASGWANPLLQVNRLRLDTTRQTVSVDGAPLDLTPLEFRLLNYLVHAGDRVVTPGELLEHLYGDDDAREANALEAMVARLRRKTGPGVIGTRRGFGHFPDRGA